MEYWCQMKDIVIIFSIAKMLGSMRGFHEKGMNHLDFRHEKRMNCLDSMTLS